MGHCLLCLIPSGQNFLPFLISCTEVDFFPSTTVTVTPPSSVACIDFTNIVVDDNIALEGEQSFNICVGDSTSMVVIIDDDGEYTPISSISSDNCVGVAGSVRVRVLYHV